MKDRGLQTLMKLLLWSTIFVGTLQGVQGETDIPGPSESECQPYIEKALKKLETGDTQSAEGDTAEDDTTHLSTNDESEIIRASHELTTDAQQSAEESTQVNDIVSTEEVQGSPLNEDDADSTSTEKHEIERRSIEEKDNSIEAQDTAEAVDSTSGETTETKEGSDEEVSKKESVETNLDQKEETSEEKTVSIEDDAASAEQIQSFEQDEGANTSQKEFSREQENTAIDSKTASTEADDSATDSKSVSLEHEDEILKTEQQSVEESEQQSIEEPEQQSVDDREQNSVESKENVSEQQKSVEDEQETVEQASAEATNKEVSAEEEHTHENTEEVQEQEAIAKTVSLEKAELQDDMDQTKEEDESKEKSIILSAEQTSHESEEENKTDSTQGEDSTEIEHSEERAESTLKDEESIENSKKEGEVSEESTDGQATDKAASREQISEQVSVEDQKAVSAEESDTVEINNSSQENAPSDADEASSEVVENLSQVEVEESNEVTTGKTKVEGSTPVEDLTWEIEIPEDLRSRKHIDEIFHLNDEETRQNSLLKITADKTLQELKKIYENAIKPLEILYKYRDLSNRHFGDSEIFSKPLVLFMGPWSGGKSSIINYLLDNEYQQTSLRTGAEPSPAYFNLLSWGEKPEVQDGTQLAADWTFSGLQKFGQGLEERLRGLRLPSKLLEKINIVEIPGILEVRKQVSRMFPFNDACQWFIDRADIIFLIYDPSKLDVGPETEAILDQLKGREYQTRIILNKADQVKPEELMRVQGALIWNISPLMSSAQPPVMYSTSLWSRPYETGAPTRLLFAQERAFLNDLKSAIDKRIEHKISSARRFAVRVRNHAKMVDCYLTTYYNHKSVFGNKKMVADQIIEHPQNYHIYEGLSTLTNISRYDLPDPDVYRDFFRLNPLYDFQQLSATCTYFRGCPINRLDIAIAYDLPELVGKYKKAVESIQSTAETITQS